MLTFLIVFFAVVLLSEVYVLTSLKGLFRTTRSRAMARSLSLIGFGLLIATVAVVWTRVNSNYVAPGYWLNGMIGVAFAFLVAKLILSIFLLLEDSYRLPKFAGMWTLGRFRSTPKKVTLEGRRHFLGKIGLGLAAIPFAGLIYGVFKGKYDYTVHRHIVRFPDLPPAFEGLRIVQLSDIHSGSFDDIEAVREGVRLVQAQNPDLILFTGDLVNSNAAEIEPYLEVFGALQAPMGKFSVLGNHDYGVHGLNPNVSPAENLQKLEKHHATMGFQLLKNQNVQLTKGGNSVRLVGVENWGQAPFPQHGDLDRALKGATADDFTILMSHDPDHWELKTLEHPKKIHLTLAGHTHGSQFGIEVPGIRWSPVQYRYKRWAGLYSEGEQHLYVNRGFGFIGYPGRVGIWPEITVLELRSA